MTKRALERKLNIYRDFIRFTHGQEILDKLDRDEAIELTNEILQIQDPVQFEALRNQIIEDYEESQKN